MADGSALPLPDTDLAVGKEVLPGQPLTPNSFARFPSRRFDQSMDHLGDLRFRLA
jgi:hypothetical protein